MGNMKPLIILLWIPTISFGQTIGKIAGNQSVKISIEVVGTDTIAMVSNLNLCESVVEIHFKDSFFSQPVKPFGHYNYLLSVAPIGVRNATPCPNGSTQMVPVPMSYDAKQIDVGKLLSKNAYRTCDWPTPGIRISNPDRDTAVATRLQ